MDRYLSGNFDDIAANNGWEIETSIASYTPESLKALSPDLSREAEIENSLIVFNSFSGMTPALATEERLWTRLCHVECLEFARARWLRNTTETSSSVRTHLFAPGLAGSRDDNAIGRLWWNGYVASIACPGDTKLGLRTLLSRANIRLQVIDRADTAFRRPLVQGIARIIIRERWFADDDKAISHFMYEVNKRSGGVVFEAFTSVGIDDHLKNCFDAAVKRAQVKS
jgi:hypothetical protein